MEILYLIWKGWLSGLTKINVKTIVLLFACSLISAAISSTVYFYLDSIPFLGYFIITLIYLVCYLLIALPIQIILNRKPRKFSAYYLVIYLTGATVVCFFVGLLYASFSLALFMIAFINAFIFWVFDSLLLQNKN
ncbi:hypothetical protein D1864_10585 [Oceanobacillus picturae]|nr:hypothetical protein D1864_10585 [Oceanobacillus picturae]